MTFASPPRSRALKHHSGVTCMTFCCHVTNHSNAFVIARYRGKKIAPQAAADDITWLHYAFSLPS